MEERRHGFRRLGEAGATGLGLSGRRARELELRAAWRAIAGPAMASRAVPVAVRRGVLEIAVGDPRWAEALRALVPRLAARLAAARPGLSIRKLRITGDGAWTDGRSEALVLDENQEVRPGRAAGDARGDANGRPAGEPSQRLRAAAERCLERLGERSAQGRDC